MQCAGTYAIKASGRVSFTADTMQGTIEISARRLGGCQELYPPN